MFRVVNWIQNSGVEAAGLFTAVYPIVNELSCYGVKVDINALKFSDSKGMWKGANVQHISYSNIFDDSDSYSINHTHGLWNFHSIASLINAKKNNRPLIISPHGMLDLWAIRQSFLKKRIAKILYESKAFSMARYVHALTVNEADDIKSIFNNVSRIEVIPNGVYVPDGYANSKKVDENINIIYLARIHSKKGINELLKAWSIFQSSFHNKTVNLIIAGWGDDEIISKIKDSKLENMKYIGPVYGVDKDNLLKSAHFLILPSFSEGLPMSVLEAWAFGVPTIMTSECNLPCGFSSDSSIKVSPTADSILDGLNYAKNMGNNEYISMAINARNLAQEKFSWKEIAKQHYELYKEVIQ